MTIIAVNGSPRKTWNTATLLGHALEGARSCGAETELIHLADYHYQGCTSCFACKLKGRKTHGECAMRDELTPVLNKIGGADGLILGSPIYIGGLTGMMQSFIERLLYPYITYEKEPTRQNNHMRAGFIYTLGATEERMKKSGFDQRAVFNDRVLTGIYGSSEYLLVNDTYQFDDYSKYETSGVDVEHKARSRNEVFPAECGKAFEMGKRVAGG